MTPIVAIHRLKKYYGKRLVLDIPELALERGKRYVLIGPNGSGKTTLLRILAGVITADEGEIETSAESVAYMPQKPYAFSFSVLKNVQLASKDKKTSEREARQALETVGLADLRRDRGNKLSGGETQRMAFARVLISRNDLILMDEPTASVDIVGGEQLDRVLLDYVTRTSCTLLLSTHTPLQAATLAQEIILLDNGLIVEQGETEQVLYHPKCSDTRHFLSHWRLS